MSFKSLKNGRSYSRMMPNVHFHIEILCAIPSMPYESTTTTTTQSINTALSDYHCVTNFKWDDEIPGWTNQSATCTMTANETAAQWVTPGNVKCIGGF